MLEKHTTFMGRFHDLRRKLADTLATLEANGIRVNPSSRFREYLRQLDAAVKADGVTVPKSLDLAVWHRSLIEIDDLALVVETLSANPPVSGWKEAVERSLSGGLRRTDEVKHSPARDIQFELVIASILRKARYDVELAEPDVMVTSETPSFGFAAKRPRTTAKMDKNIRDGDKQIIRTPFDGILALDLTVLVSPTDAHLTTTDFAAAFEFVKQVANNFIHRNGGRVRSLVTTARTFGLIVHVAAPVYDAATPRLAYARRWSISNLCDLNDPRTDILRKLTERLAVVESAG